MRDDKFGGEIPERVKAATRALRLADISEKPTDFKHESVGTGDWMKRAACLSPVGSDNPVANSPL